MRLKFLIVLISFSTIAKSYSQKSIDHYYDYHWHTCTPDDARFYSLIKFTDSGSYRNDYYVNLNKLQMAGLYEDQACTLRNGTFYWFYPGAILKSTGKYVHDKRSGLWMDYYQDNSPKDSLNYVDGHLSGISLSWYKDGGNMDSSNIDENGNGVYVSWFSNGSPASAGRYVDFNKQQGKWQYFHDNGKLSSLEMYDHGNLVDKNYFDENGNPLADTTSVDADLSFKGGEKAWSKYLSKNLYFPAGYQFKNGYQAVVVVTATVDENGKVVDVELNVPLNKAFDKVAIDAMKDSKEWLPAISHNRKVYGSISQAINFSQSYY